MRDGMYYIVGMALSLVLVSMPVLASEMDNNITGGSFRALEDIMAQNNQKLLKPFSDDQLDSIEGEGFCFGCGSFDVRINVSPVIQFGLVNQFNFAFGNNIFQENNAFVGNHVRFSRHRH